MTAWDIVLSACIVLAVFIGGRISGYNRGFSDGAEVERRRQMFRRR